MYLQLFLSMYFATLFNLQLASGYSYVTDYFQLPRYVLAGFIQDLLDSLIPKLDHFSFAVNTTFKLRYLYNDTHWNRSGHGPIFLYTGNEGNIETFAKNTGFMWEIAEEFGALLVFAEHRFYGKSFPDQFSHSNDHDNSVIGYLTVEQVLADFAKLIVGLKKALNAESSPVVAFGGSYGGQLTAYLRMKYPHLVQGGIASSAPLFLTDSTCDLHDKVLATVFGKYSPNCVVSIRNSWTAINKVAQTDDGMKWLTKHWKLCDPLTTTTDVNVLKSWLQIMYSSLGMANYPYPTDFLQDLPAYPVKEFCRRVTSSSPESHTTMEDADKSLLERLYQGLDLYFNHSGISKCLNFNNIAETNAAFSDRDSQSFSYQSCTELLDPACDNGVDDFFEPQIWNFEQFSQGCYDDFGVKPQPDILNQFYGGRNILGASNIVFSNGNLDPWFEYGVLKNVSESLLAIIIEDAAHHLDLRASNPNDPPSVIWARKFEIAVIYRWIQEFQQNQIKLREL